MPKGVRSRAGSSVTAGGARLPPVAGFVLELAASSASGELGEAAGAATDGDDDTETDDAAPGFVSDNFC